MDRFRIGIIGADTRQGRQLIKLLLAHPVAELVAVSARNGDPRPVGEVFPSLDGLCRMSFTQPSRVLELADVVFNADMTADSQELAAQSIRSKCVFLDAGPSYRLASEEEFRQWFGGSFAYPGLNDAAVYGLPELLREHMTGRVLVSLPGPTATAALLALVPLLREVLVEQDGIFIDAKLPWDDCRAPDTEGITALAAGQYPETPEIEQMLSEAVGRTVRVMLAPSCTPSRRGLLVTCCARAALSASTRTIQNALESWYSGERFVRVLPAHSRDAATDTVVGTNVCEISARFDERTGRVVVCAALDSLMKGSAGQAVQCMNRVLSMPEEVGLEALPFN